MRIRSWLSVGVVIGLVSLVAACSGGGSKSDQARSSFTRVTRDGVEEVAAPVRVRATPVAQDIAVDVRGGWKSFGIHVTSATYQPDDEEAVVKADITALGSNTPQTDDFAGWLVTGWDAYLLTDVDVPPVLQGSTGEARFEFPVLPGAGAGPPLDLRAATLVFTEPGSEPTRLPLGPSAPATTSQHAPVELGSDTGLGQVQLADALGTVAITGGRLRAGSVGGGAAATGRRWLSVDYTMTPGPDLGAVGVFPQRSIRLGLPDGSVLGGGDGAPFDPHLLSGDAAVAGSIDFQVPVPSGGTYTLRLGAASATFTVPADEYGSSVPATGALDPVQPRCPDDVAGAPIRVGSLRGLVCSATPFDDGTDVVLSLANPSEFPYTPTRWLGLKLGSDDDAPAGTLVAGTDVPNGEHGLVLMHFTGVDRSAATTGELADLARDLRVPTDDDDRPAVFEAQDVDQVLDASGGTAALTSDDGVVRVTGLELTPGAFNEWKVNAPGRVYLAMRFDFLTASATGSALDAALSDALTVYSPTTSIALTSPGGQRANPVDVIPVNAVASPGDQLRGVVVLFDIPDPIAGSYELGYQPTQGDPPAPWRFELP